MTASNPIPVFSLKELEEMMAFKEAYPFPDHQVIKSKYPSIIIEQIDYKVAALVYATLIPEHFHTIESLAKRQKKVSRTQVRQAFQDFMVREALQRAIDSDLHLSTVSKRKALWNLGS